MPPDGTSVAYLTGDDDPGRNCRQRANWAYCVRRRRRRRDMTKWFSIASKRRAPWSPPRPN